MHAANSAATLAAPDAHFDMVRCGVAIYGLDPFGRSAAEQRLAPALSVHSYVADVKRFGAGASAGYGATWHAAAGHVRRRRADRLRRRRSPGAEQQRRRPRRRPPPPDRRHDLDGQPDGRPRAGARSSSPASRWSCSARRANRRSPRRSSRRRSGRSTTRSPAASPRECRGSTAGERRAREPRAAAVAERIAGSPSGRRALEALPRA